MVKHAYISLESEPKLVIAVRRPTSTEVKQGLSTVEVALGLAKGFMGLTVKPTKGGEETLVLPFTSEVLTWLAAVRDAGYILSELHTPTGILYKRMELDRGFLSALTSILKTLINDKTNVAS